jgi:Fic family protein
MKIIPPPKINLDSVKVVIEKNIKYNIKPSAVTSDNKYLHWDKLRHLIVPNKFDSIEEYWFFIKYSRISKYENLPFIENFVYVLTDKIQESLHQIDSLTHGTIDARIPSNNRQYITRSLIDEAISSSQIEGASTTRVAAKEMLRSGREPKDYSEQMIYNNYQVMRFIGEYKNSEITPSIILEIHKIVTDNTLDNPNDAGRLRQHNEVKVVENITGNILHTPPNYQELPDRMQVLCNFINNKASNKFIHPVLRAIITHFILAYDHPFVDGNGRTARALFYLVLMKNNYWLFKYISISRYIYQAVAQYGKSFLKVESDDFDLTYFILNQLKFIQQATDDLFDYIDTQQHKLQNALELLQTYLSHSKLNSRQVLLLQNALDKSGKVYTVNQYKLLHNINTVTARNDLVKLAKLGLLAQSKSSREFIFIAPNDLKERIKNYKNNA